MTAAVPLILPALAPAPLSIVVEFVALRFGEGCVVNLVGGLRTALPRPDVHFDARECFVGEDVKTLAAAAVRGDVGPEIRALARMARIIRCRCANSSERWCGLSAWATP